MSSEKATTAEALRQAMDIIPSAMEIARRHANDATMPTTAAEAQALWRGARCPE